MPLTPKRERFCQEYLIEPVGTKAAIRAGFSEHSAAQYAVELLNEPEVAARIEQLQAERAAVLRLSAEWVLAKLMTVNERALQAEEVTEWDFREKCFKPTGQYKFDSNGANRSAELIGKHLGMFNEKSKIELTGSVQVEYSPIDLSKLSDAEIESLTLLLAKAGAGSGETAAQVEQD